MNLQDQMARDYKRYQERRNKLRATRDVINGLLEFENRMNPRTRAALIEASSRLWDEMLDGDAVFD